MRWLFVGIVALNVLYLAWTLAAPEAGAMQAPLENAANEREFPAQLQLLGQGGAGATPAIVPQVVSNVGPAGCPSVGPFSEDDAAQFLGRLGEMGFRASVINEDAGSAPVYWVYLPPHENRQQALRKLRELQAAGIDSFVVATGPDINALSLGSFSNRASAMGLQGRLRAAGYAAQVREQLKEVRERWVVLADRDAQGFLEFAPPALHASLRIERRPCPQADH